MADTDTESNGTPIQFENTIDSTRPFDGRIFSVRVDTVELPSGRRTIREVRNIPTRCA